MRTVNIANMILLQVFFLTVGTTLVTSDQIIGIFTRCDGNMNKTDLQRQAVLYDNVINETFNFAKKTYSKLTILVALRIIFDLQF